MQTIPMVENPRRRRRRGRRGGYTAAQLAAGFGGRTRMHGGGGRRRRRYHNPGLSLLSGNPRRRRHRRYAGSFRRYHRRRNPGLFSGGGLLGMVDLKGAAYIAGGIIAARMTPKLLLKVWPGAPTTGFGLYGVHFAGALAAAFAVKLVTKSTAAAHQVAAGGIGYTLFEIANDYLLPSVGLAGLMSDPYLTTDQFRQISGYQASRHVSLSDFQPNVLPEMSV